MNGMVFDIQRCSYVDGPGLRTTVFFKGCNLRCGWCHNPESQRSETELMFYKNRCCGCGKCREVCPHHLETCTFCGRCALFCPNDAREVCGKAMGISEILDQVLLDKKYYETSGGGVTCSGGECMLQPEFLAEFLAACKENGIHTAVDTAGAVPWSSFEAALPYTDLFLYDVKCVSQALHREDTGVPNTRILANLKELSARGAEIIIRIPVIGGFNDSRGEMLRISEFLKGINCRKAELLPYHAMGENKYPALGREGRVYRVPDPAAMEEFQAIIGSSSMHRS